MTAADTPRPIDRTPRQVAGPGVDDVPTADDGSATGDRPRDPHPVAADPDDVERLQADEVVDVRDVRDPDLADADADPAPAHLVDVDDDATAHDAPEAHLSGGDTDRETAAGDLDARGSDPDLEPEPLQPEPLGPEPLGPEPVGVDEDDLDEDDLDEVDLEEVELDEPGPDPAPAPTSDVEPDAEPDVAPEPVGASAGFMADTSVLRERWESVQVGFVDDPRHAVEEADDMVAAAVSELQAQIDRQRDELGGPWRGDDAASTDALLAAFQGYRDLFDRVLGV